MYPPNIDNGGADSKIEHRKEVPTNDNNKDNDEEKETEKKTEKKDNRFSLIAHEYNDITNYYLTSKCIIPANDKTDKKYFGINDVGFCLSAHYHKQRQWHRHPKLRLYQYFNGGGLRFFREDMTSDKGIWVKYFENKNNALSYKELMNMYVFDPVLNLQKCDA
eukprot:107900_1